MRTIALYLPQFHPIPENDVWWGKGFTEWTNVAKARRRYPGHYQPRVPADLGFYDLRVPETREAQAELARTYGIDAFSYWHYWFAGRRLLERPFAEVLASGRPRFPFCLGWANESWSGVWHGAPGRLLMEQTYPGAADHDAHFDTVLPAFLDDRYVRVDGKPLFLIYRPRQIPEVERFVDQWRKRAHQAGFPGVYFVGVVQPGDSSRAAAMDAHLLYGPDGSKLRLWGLFSPRLRRALRPMLQGGRPRKGGGESATAMPTVPRRPWPRIFTYADFVETAYRDVDFGRNALPVVVPGWDNTPRTGANGTVLHGVSPALFERHVREAAAIVALRPRQEALLFVRSWNEWAEGNHLEPDLAFGTTLLEALSSALRSRDD